MLPSEVTWFFDNYAQFKNNEIVLKSVNRVF